MSIKVLLPAAFTRHTDGRKQFDSAARNLPGLLADIEPTEHVEVALREDLLEVIQQATSTADHHQQSAPTGKILRMRAKMLGQLANACCQQSDLDLGRARVLVVRAVLSDQLVLLLGGDHRLLLVT